MDQLINNIVASNHPENVKQQLVETILNNVTNNPKTATDCRLLLSQLTEWILTSDQEYLKKKSLGAYQKLATLNMSVFQEFCSPAYMIDLFSNSRYTNRVNIFGLVTTALYCLRKSESNDTNSQFKRTLLRVIRSQSVVYMRQHGVNLQVANGMAQMYTFLPETLPEGAEASKLASVIVNLLATYRAPTSPQQLVSFRRDTGVVAGVLEALWNKSSVASVQATLDTLNDVYVLISGTGDSVPSPCLSSVIERVPSNLMTIASKTILDQSDTEVGETKLVTALTRLVEWLTIWPAAKLASWVLHLMQGVSRPSILIAVTDDTLLKLAKSLIIPVFRTQTVEIFFFLLYGYQHAQTAFHKIISELPNILDELVAGGAPARDAHERLSEAARYMTEVFPGYPELYTPLLTKIVASPGISEQRRNLLGRRSWIREGSFSGIKEKPNVGSSIASVAGGSSSGMVGLMNLGNTCYMNSVLQALHMSPRFADEVFQKSPSTQQPVLQSIQQVLSFLRYSQRTIYSPNEFHRVGRPPWFEAGRQQDCSEFLRYLLDTLSEEEKTFNNQINPTQETRIAPLNCISEIPETDSAIKDAAPDQDDDMESQVSVEEWDGSRNSLNNSADVNLGEQTTEGTAGLADSRTSLMEEGLGSRGSHGSLGMQRWCTEENLSVSGSSGSREVLNVSIGGSTGSREALCHGSREVLGSTEALGSREALYRSREALGSREGLCHESSATVEEGKQAQLEGMIHDSHSNSTDSGIQSVGDSANGSEDKLSEGDGLVVEVASGEPVPTAILPKKVPKPISLVHKLFGGRVETCIECRYCQHKSAQQDWFLDLSLAIPQVQKVADQATETSTTKDAKENVTLTSTSTTDEEPKPPTSSEALDASSGIISPGEPMDTKSAQESRSTSPLSPVSMEVGSVDLMSPPAITVTPPVENDVVKVTSSDAQETTGEIEESVLKKAKTDTSSVDAVVTPSNPMASDLSVTDLIDNYLASESLDGENQYQCDACNKKRDATKTTKILTAPPHLNVTLLRFKYDRKTNRRAKVFVNIHYPLELQLPIASDKSESETEMVSYRLYGVVVHSGYTSDGGHYYTWARNPDSNLWRVFNDSVVKASTWESFTERSSKLSRDTAYLLFYQRQDMDPPVTAVQPTRAVLDAVERDNIKYLRAKETFSRSPGSSGVTRPVPRKDDDGSGPSGCGGSLNFGGGHYVC